MMLKIMKVIDNEYGDDDVDDVDRDWSVDGVVNEDDDIVVNEGRVVVDVSGEDFDAHIVEDIDDYNFD